MFSRVGSLLVHGILPWVCRVVLGVNRLNRLRDLWLLPADPIAMVNRVCLRVGGLDWIFRLLDIPLSVRGQGIRREVPRVVNLFVLLLWLWSGRLPWFRLWSWDRLWLDGLGIPWIHLRGWNWLRLRRQWIPLVYLWSWDWLWLDGLRVPWVNLWSWNRLWLDRLRVPWVNLRSWNWFRFRRQGVPRFNFRLRRLDWLRIQRFNNRLWLDMLRIPRFSNRLGLWDR